VFTPTPRITTPDLFNNKIERLRYILFEFKKKEFLKSHNRMILFRTNNPGEISFFFFNYSTFHRNKGALLLMNV